MKPLSNCYWILSLTLAGTIACAGGGSQSMSSPSTPAAATTQAATAVMKGTAVPRPIPANIEGSLANRSGSCPALTFTVHATTVSTTANTAFVGQTCAQLTNGATIFVEGTLQNGAIVATTVRSELRVVQIRGTVSGLSPVSGCPIATFMVGTTAVSTTANTRFTGQTCAQLTSGSTVVVTGTLQNGSVVATDVQTVQRFVHVRGAISGLSPVSGCPVLKFTIGTTAVSTTASTRFTGQTCAHLTNGSTVAVDGTLQNGSVVATDVSRRP